jgi:yopX protein|nr:MAG TPA: YopX protein [Caudoviricetes sp.]
MRKNTNFKDRNSKCIYEGDIIKIFETNLYGEETNSYCVNVSAKGDYCGFVDLLEDYLNICEVK